MQDSRNGVYLLTQRNIEEASIICVDGERYIGLDLAQDGMFRKIAESQSQYVRRWTHLDRDLTLPDILQFLAVLLVIQTVERHQKQSVSETLRMVTKNVRCILTVLQSCVDAAAARRQHLAVWNLSHMNRSGDHVLSEIRKRCRKIGKRGSLQNQTFV